MEGPDHPMNFLSLINTPNSCHIPQKSMVSVVPVHLRQESIMQYSCAPGWLTCDPLTSY